MSTTNTRRASRQAPTTIEALEARQLMAATFVGTDTDNDQYTIKLTGPGSFNAVTNQGGTDGFLEVLTISGTDGTSKLTITIKKAAAGDGRLRMNNLIAGAALNSFSAAKVDVPAFGGVDFDRIRTLTLGNLGAESEIFVAGGDTDRTNITLASFGVGNKATLTVNARIGTLSIGTGFFKAELARGADTMKFKNGTSFTAAIPANALFPVSIGKVTGSSGIAIDGDVAGRIGSITGTDVDLDFNTFGSIGTIKSTTGDVFGTSNGGPIDSITARQQLSGDWTVDRIGTLTAGALIAAFTAQFATPDALGFTLKSMKAPRIDNSSLGLASGGVPGIIKSIESTSSQNSLLDIEAAAVQSIKAKGGFSTTMTLAGGVFPVRLGSITVTARLEATVTCEDAGVSTIKAGELKFSAFRTLFIGEVNVVKSGVASGTLEDVLLKAVGTNPLTGFGVRKVTVAGSANDMRLRSFGPVGTVDVLTLGGESIVYSGDIAGGGLPDDLTSFDSAGRIDSVKVRRAFSSQPGNEAFNTSAIAAPTIGSVSINGKINPDFGGTPFGIGFRTVTGQIAFRDNAGVLVKPVFTATPGNFSLFAGSGDFFVRVYA